MADPAPQSTDGSYAVGFVCGLMGGCAAVVAGAFVGPETRRGMVHGVYANIGLVVLTMVVVAVVSTLRGG